MIHAVKERFASYAIARNDETMPCAPRFPRAGKKFPAAGFALCRACIMRENFRPVALAAAGIRRDDLENAFHAAVFDCVLLRTPDR